jgi:hypothetical protein
MACGSVEEVLGVAGSSHGAHGIRGASRRASQRRGHKPLQPHRFGERHKTTERAFAVRRGGADQQPRRTLLVRRGRPTVKAFRQTGSTVPARHRHLADQHMRQRVQQPVPRSRQPRIGVDEFGRLGETAPEVPLVCIPMGRPQLRAVDGARLFVLTRPRQAHQRNSRRTTPRASPEEPRVEPSMAAHHVLLPYATRTEVCLHTVAGHPLAPRRAPATTG